MESLIWDVRRGAHRLLRDRTFSLVALLCLGLGVGANTAVFSVVNAVLLSPLPFDEPDEVALIWTVSASATEGDTEYFTRPRNFVEMRHARGFAAIEALIDFEFDVSDPESEPERVRGGRSSVGLFDLVGATPAVGRLFAPEDGTSGRGDVAVISQGFFDRRFGGDPEALGRSLSVDGRTHTIIGIVPDRTAFPLDGEVWVPLVTDDLADAELDRGMLTVLGRLGPGQSLEQARESLDDAASTLREMYPRINADFGLDAAVLHDRLVEDVQGRINALTVAVALLLVITCANVANLLLVRGQREARTAALSASLGATRPRLVRQFLTENAVLAFAGGGMGVALAYFAVPPLLALMPDDVPGFDQVRVDGTALLFGLGAAMGTLLLFGLLPAMRGSTADPGSLLRGGGRVGSTAASRRLQSSLVVLQICVGIVLLAGSGLLGRSLLRLEAVDPGFEAEGAITFKINPGSARYADHASRVDLLRRVEEEVATLPTVRSVGGVHALPIGGTPWGVAFNVENRIPEEENGIEVAFYRLTTPGYLEALGIPLLRGRDFTDDDVVDGPLVAIVSQTLVDAYWPGESGIGKRVKRGPYHGENPWRTVVGVVGDLRDRGLSDAIGGALYLPLGQRDLPYASTMNVVVRTDGDPAELAPAIRERVRRVDPSMPLFDVEVLTGIVSRSVAAERFTAVLIMVFSVLGLIVTGVGVYGVMAHAVGERRREIAVRVALGAQATSVAGMVVRKAVLIAGLGVALGLVAAVGLGGLARDLLFDAPTVDPLVLGAVSVGMGLVAVVACVVPARRASRVEPSRTLRLD